MRSLLKLSLLHSLVVGALWLAALPALAGTITISIATGPITGSVVKTITDADAATFIAWCQSAYPGPIVGGVPTILAAGPCLQAWALGIFAGTVNNVTSWSKNSAASTAATAVVPIAIQ
jgi:hypothetical protein